MCGFRQITIFMQAFLKRNATGRNLNYWALWGRGWALREEARQERTLPIAVPAYGRYRSVDASYIGLGIFSRPI
jgi:hypothetical protein